MESGKVHMVQVMMMKVGAHILTNTNIMSIKVHQTTTNLAIEENNNNEVAFGKEQFHVGGAHQSPTPFYLDSPSTYYHQDSPSTYFHQD